MNAKRLMILLVTAVLTLGVASFGFSAQEVEGTISKIEAPFVTVENDTGEQVTVQVKDPDTLNSLQIGERVLVKDGKVTKAGG